MAPIQAGVVPMQQWELYYSSGGVSGNLFVWAPDADTAIATVRANPSDFGLHENPLVGQPTRRICGDGRANGRVSR